MEDELTTEQKLRLMKAAPRMLEALEEATHWVSEYIFQMSSYTISDEASVCLQSMRLAIAEATGAQP